MLVAAWCIIEFSLSSRADEVATDERTTDTGNKVAHVATTNVSAIAERSRSDRATAVSARIFGTNRLTRIWDLQDIRQQKIAWLSCRFSFSCIENMHLRTIDRKK